MFHSSRITGVWVAPGCQSQLGARIGEVGVGLDPRDVAALVSGALFLSHGLQGLRAKTGKRWARNEFVASLGYVTVLLAMLVVDHAYSSNSRAIALPRREILHKQ